MYSSLELVIMGFTQGIKPQACLAVHAYASSDWPRHRSYLVASTSNPHRSGGEMSEHGAGIAVRCIAVRV